MYKQILGSIAIFVILIVCSIADFDVHKDTQQDTGWDASQEPCLEFEIPEHLLDGSDSSCARAAEIMKMALDQHIAECIEIINEGWIPANKRILSKDEIDYLVALNGAPETRSLEEIPCEDCPFDKLERCPKCVEIHEEAYQQMAGED